MKLKESPIFEGLNATQFANFVSACTEERYEPGASIIKQGERGDAVFFVLEGEARVFIVRDGEETELTVLRPPAVIGEMQLLTERPRTAWVRAVSEVTVLMIPFEALRARIEDGDVGTLKIMYAIARVLAHRLMAMDRKLGKISEGNATVRQSLSDFNVRLMSEWSLQGGGGEGSWN